MLTLLVPLGLTLLTAAVALLAMASSAGCWVLVAILGVAALIGWYDVIQRRHSVLRNYPVLGHMRFLLEKIRPEIQQYFIERNTDGRPYDRDIRSIIYERAKGIHGEIAFGTERDVNEVGYECVLHSSAPQEPRDEPPRVRIGGPDCTQPYDMALLNVSAMSFGALSANAIRALNLGARRGGFAHDTGEGGLTKYHLEHGGDLIWEIGSGYFGARTEDGDFDPEMFRDKAANQQVKCVSLKLSQGAKPGIGGVLPGGEGVCRDRRGTQRPGRRERASARQRTPCSRRRANSSVRGAHARARRRQAHRLQAVRRIRHELLAICKAMLAEGITPDFIVVDGSEGGTGAAPLEYEDHVGTPLTDGLMTVHNALVGAGLRDRITPRRQRQGRHRHRHRQTADAGRRLHERRAGDDAGRRLHPVAALSHQQVPGRRRHPGPSASSRTRRRRQDRPRRAVPIGHGRAGAADDRVARVDSPTDLHPAMLMRRVDPVRTASYFELYDWLGDGELLAEPPTGWAADWAAADPDRFTRTAGGRRE